MFGLEWRLTLLTLVVLPAFIIPARRVGRKLQVITRDGFNLNASMSNTIAERFNVAGALVVKLFGKQDRERDDFSDRAAQRPRHRRDARRCTRACSLVALGFVAAVGTAIVYYVGGRHGDRRHDHDRHARRARRCSSRRSTSRSRSSRTPASTS